MKLKAVSISNFRKLADISFECSKHITTIVGPNGIGKSSILDALRVVKAILLPVAKDEGQQTLQHSGLFSPHLNQVLVENISGDLNRETVIDLRIEISSEEMEYLRGDLNNFNLLRLENQLGQNNIGSINLIAFLSSPLGQQQQQRIQEETMAFLSDFDQNKVAHIKLSISKGQIRGYNGFHQQLVSYLLRSPNFSETLFTVFPADRNFPTGDANIQLGQNEISQQLLSYSIQPQLKFTRLKAAIISYIMINSNDISPIQKDFKLIFDNLIPGKELSGINLEQRTGRLSVLIKEKGTQTEYDIDFLSSGEKGLLLTLFLLLRTVRPNGIVFIDEPELHLNPAVCKNIVPFIKKHICGEKNAQVFLTTHSSEILAFTKEDEECSLLHLIDETTISPIYKKDNEEAQEAIKSLGVSTSDLLFNKGVIYLEGVTDDNYMYEVLKGIVDGFKIQSLGGRTVIENEINTLQDADRKGNLRGFHVFILDLDGKPTALRDSQNVKLIQWDRYSFENYLLNLNLLYDVVKELENGGFPTNRAEFSRQVKDIAFGQIDEIAVFEALTKVSPPSSYLTRKECKSKSADEIAQLIGDKIRNLKSSLVDFEESTFQDTFKNELESKKKEIKADWEENWKVKCKGKELLIAIHGKYKIKNYNAFILSLISVNKQKDSEEWKILKSKLQPIIEKGK